MGGRTNLQEPDELETLERKIAFPYGAQFPIVGGSESAEEVMVVPGRLALRMANSELVFFLDATLERGPHEEKRARRRAGLRTRP